MKFDTQTKKGLKNLKQVMDYSMDLGTWHKPDCDIDRTNMDESFEQYSSPTISDWIRHIDKLIMMMRDWEYVKFGTYYKQLYEDVTNEIVSKPLKKLKTKWAVDLNAVMKIREFFRGKIKRVCLPNTYDDEGNVEHYNYCTRLNPSIFEYGNKMWKEYKVLKGDRRSKRNYVSHA